MKRTSRFILMFLFFILFLFLFVLPSTPFRITLIPLNASDETVDVKKSDLMLVINNVPREITELSKEVQSLSKKSQLGRNFILSFNLIDYGQHIIQGITYFVNEILYPGDRLLLISPQMIYQIKVIKKKEQLLETILRLVKKDSYIYKSNRSSSEKNLEKILKRLDRIIDETSTTREGDLYSIYNLNKKTAVHQFISNYSREFRSFKNQFLLPDIGKFQGTLDKLISQDGERWWIHFQQRDIYPSLSSLKQMISKIRGYLSSLVRGEDISWASSIAARISQLEKQLFLKDQYPLDRHLEIIRKGDIHYNVLFFQNLRQRGIESIRNITPDLETILQELVILSGGKAVISNDLKDGMRLIKNHSVCFFNLFWDFNGMIENKDIKLIVENTNINFGYRESFSEDEIKRLYHLYSEKKVRIEDVGINSNLLKFSIVNFVLNKEKVYGILNVEINLFNSENANVYTSKKSMRGYKEKIDISLPFIDIKPGLYRLKIIVYDLLANTENHSISKVHLE